MQRFPATTPDPRVRMVSARRAVRWIPLGVMLALALALAAFVAGCGSSGTASFGSPVAGKHVYDRAGILTASQVSMLEVRATVVQRAGAPTIVYLQTKNATYDETLQDAQDLMTAWDVESAPNAHDGLVIFLNLKPNDTHHGQVALYGGQKLVQGPLPQDELQRIYQQVMLPSLQSGDTAGGIAAGLDAIQHDLVFGAPPPPPPSAAERIMAFLVGLPLLALALLFAALVALLVVRSRRPKPPIPPAQGTMPPEELAPGIVGALVGGRVGDNQMMATLLDLARRGILAIEPAGRNRAQLRILNRAPQLEGYEESVFRAVSDMADAEGIVAPSDLGKIRSQWAPAKQELRAELLQRGWYDAEASSRRVPLYILGAIALALALAGYIASAIGNAPIGILGSSILLAAGIVALSVGYSIPDTTLAGAEAAAPWSGYLDAVQSARRDAAVGADMTAMLDAAVPYAVASGTVSRLRKQLKDAGHQGYQPIWLGRSGDQPLAYGNFYPIWIAFVSATSPSSGGTGSGTGAAAGGAGAGGGF